MSDTGGPFEVVRNFVAALGEYTGAPHVVTTTSCTMALLLACAWHLGGRGAFWANDPRHLGGEPECVEIPRRTYVGVPMSILHAGGRPVFRNEEWVGEYRLEPLPIWDCARWLRAGMYRPGTMMCLSFHHTKHLPLAAHVVPSCSMIQRPPPGCAGRASTAAPRACRRGRIPKTGDDLEITRRTVITFRASNQLKASMEKTNE